MATIGTNALGQPVGPALDAWTPRPSPPDSPMTGRACRVVRLDPEAHGESLHEAFGRDADAANWTYLPAGPFADRTAFDAWLGGARRVPTRASTPWWTCRPVGPWASSP